MFVFQFFYSWNCEKEQIQFCFVCYSFSCHWHCNSAIFWITQNCNKCASVFCLNNDNKKWTWITYCPMSCMYLRHLGLSFLFNNVNFTDITISVYITNTNNLFHLTIENRESCKCSCIYCTQFSLYRIKKCVPFYSPHIILETEWTGIISLVNLSSTRQIIFGTCINISFF